MASGGDGRGPQIQLAGNEPVLLIPQAQLAKPRVERCRDGKGADLLGQLQAILGSYMALGNEETDRYTRSLQG